MNTPEQTRSATAETGSASASANGFLLKWLLLKYTGLAIAVLLFIFSVMSVRLEKWVALDKEIFGYGQTPGNFLPESMVTLMQRTQQFNSLPLLILTGLLLVLVACGPALILMRKGRTWLGVGYNHFVIFLLGCGVAFLTYQAYRVPNVRFAEEFNAPEVPDFSRADYYTDQLLSEQLDIDTANGFVGMLGWLEERSRYGLNARPLPQRERLVSFAGDESKPPQHRLVAAAAVLRLLSNDEIEAELHFEPMKKAAESAKDLEGDTLFVLLRQVGRTTGADLGGALAFE